MSGRTVKVVLEFSEADLNQILGFAFVGDAPPAVADMSEAQFAELGNQLQNASGAFAEEIVAGTEDASDFLYDFMEQFE